MNFDASLRERWERKGETWCFEIPQGWLQGRAVFGGLLTAAAVGLGLRQLEESDSSWVVRTVTTQFLRPAAAGELTGEFRIERQGRNVTFAETRLHQNGDVVVIVSQTFIRPRENAMTIEAPIHTSEVDPDSLVELPYIPGVVPEFIQNIQMRWAEGGFPFSSSEEARTVGVCRFKTPAGDLEEILGLLDVWPCPSLSLLSKPSAASSVNWTAHILRIPEPSRTSTRTPSTPSTPSTSDWFSFTYQTVAAAAGFHTVVGRLFAPDGKLVGWTEQLVVVFD